MQEILAVVAEAKGWTLQEAAEKTLSNFSEFYAGHLPAAVVAVMGRMAAERRDPAAVAAGVSGAPRG